MQPLTGYLECGRTPLSAHIPGEGRGLRRACSARLVVLRTILTVTLLFASGAQAFVDDRIDIIVDEKITYDSNVFRLSDGQPPPAGSSARADLSATTTVGLVFDVPYSRQRFQGGLTVNDTRYRRLSSLDFQGHDGRALWLWQIGRDWSGQLGYSHVSTQASFASDDTAFRGVRRTNQLTTEEMLFKGGYLVTPYWRLGGGITRREQANSDVLREPNDVEIVATEFNITHISRAKNQFGVNLRHEDGQYPNLLPIRNASGTIIDSIDNAYQQKSIGVFTDWTLTGRSRLTARLDHVNRSYDQLPQRDFEGFTARAAHDWKPTGRLVVVTTVQRDISAVEEINTSFVRVTGVSVRPTLTLTGRTTLSGALEYAIRDYLGDPVPVLTTTPPRTDRSRLAAVTLAWRADRVLTMMFGLQYEKRTSNLPDNDYDVYLVTLSGRLRF